MAIPVSRVPLQTRSQAAAEALPRADNAHVKGWAVVGAICLAFMTYVIVKWVTGPFFQSVDAGPSKVPGWMSTTLWVWQIAGVPVVAWFVWHFVIKPWRRDGQPSFDGMLCIACGLLYFQDPLGNFYQHWFTYNTSLVQVGSWVNDVPGWLSFGQPGQQLTEPILFTAQTYIWWFFGCTILGCWCMRKAKVRWPHISKFGLMAVAFVCAALVDLILEGLVMMPLGAYVYPGARGPMFFGGTYHQFPIIECIFAGFLFGGLTCLRYFRNDRGETVAERGIENMKVSAGRKSALRFLAIVGATQMIMLVGYNIPVAGFVAPNSASWPDSIQNKSYFTSGICGQGTDRPCPDPNLPNTRGDNPGIYINNEGKVVVRPGVELPKFVPFEDTK